MPKGAVIKTEVKKEISLNAPETCMACRTPNVATFPVYLTELDGKITQAGHVGRCANCGTIKHYGVNNCIGRFSGSSKKLLKADFHRWAVLKRNGIRPSDWIEAVCAASRNKEQMIWLDARNGLLPAEPEGKWKDVLKRWEALVNEKRYV